MSKNTTTTRDYQDWIGADVYDQSGDKIGSIDQIYLDDQGGQPEWLTVSTGWFGASTQFVPIAGSSTHDDGLKVPYSTDHIKDAPAVDADQHLDADQERKLYSHYGLDYDSADHETAYGGRERPDEGYDYDTTDTDASVTLSEEQLAVDKVQRESGTVRLRKYVTEEDVNVTVPVKKQVARIVRTDATGTTPGNITDSDVIEEVTLKEEEVIVDKNVVAKENVAIVTETVNDQREVSDTVRKEQVDVDGAVDDTTGR
ncbi:DUF2382 domain-containing protein [Ilumatobacter sp.]|uniref:DUF2382 domain-containing protein n=1 Tax=Ilumatobacter sp. TaxID=1967498 RepID=UPI003B51594F